MAEGQTPSRASIVYDFLAVILIIGIGIFVVYYFITPRIGSTGQWLLRFVYLVIIVVGVIIAINGFGRLVKNQIVPRASPSVGSSLRLAFNVLAYVALMVVVFAYLGVDITGVLVGAGFLGIVLGLAAQTVLGNFLGALAIMFTRPFVVGDRISFINSTYGIIWTSYPHENQGVEHFGKVKEINLIYTHFEGDDGRPFVVANGMLMQALIRNYSRGSARAVRVRFPVPRSQEYGEFRQKALAALAELGFVKKGSLQLTLASMDAKSYDVVVEVTGIGGEDAGIRSEILTKLLSITPPVP